MLYLIFGNSSTFLKLWKMSHILEDLVYISFKHWAQTPLDLAILFLNQVIPN